MYKVPLINTYCCLMAVAAGLAPATLMNKHQALTC